MTSITDVQDALLSRYGLWPGDGWQESLPRVLRDVGQAARVSERDLLDRVLREPDLLKEIAGRMTIPESFFFRHPEQLETICDYITQKAAINVSSSPVRVWSAGCSQGEEPYSLAILLRERLSILAGARVSIFANDINGTAINTARDGIYTPWSFRITSPLRKQAYFETLDERRFRLLPEIRTMVAFNHGSIQDQLLSLLPESVDVILFRNVAIYLSETALNELFAKFAVVLKPDGLLCLSCSDPPTHSAEFVKSDDASGAIYQKRGGSASQCVPTMQLIASVEGFNDETVIELPESTRRNEESRPKTEAEYRKAMFEEPFNPMARFWYAITLFEKESQNRSMAQMNALADDLEKLDRKHLLNDGETTAGELLNTVRSFLGKVAAER